MGVLQAPRRDSPGDEAPTTDWAAIVELFLAGKAPHTRRGYGGDLADWYGWCVAHHLDPLAAQRADISAYCAGLDGDRQAAGTIRHKLSAINGAYRTAVTEDLLDRNPAEHVQRPRDLD